MFSCNQKILHILRALLRILQSLAIILIIISYMTVQGQNSTLICIVSSIIIVFIISLNILQKVYTQYRQKLNLMNSLIMIFVLLIFDENGRIYIFCSNILFILYLENEDIKIPKEIIIYIFVSALVTQFWNLYNNENITQIIVVIISFLLSIGYILLDFHILSKQQSLKQKLDDPITSRSEFDSIIERLAWLNGSQAYLFDSNVKLVHTFSNDQTFKENEQMKNLMFQINNQNLKLIPLIFNQKNQFTNKPFQQYLSQENRIIVNIIYFKYQENTYYVVYYVTVPKLYNKLVQLLDFSASISHELSTHLNCIITLAQICYENFDINNTLKESVMEPIISNGQQLELIINNLKDYNNIQSNNFTSHIQRFNIVEELNEICAFFKMIILEKKLTISYQILIDSHFIESDKQRFRQIAYQIIQNAIKLTHNNDIKIVLSNDASNLIKIEIIDQGIGMNDQEQLNLKQILTNNQLIRVSTQSVGCSLGLYISNQLAQKIGDERSINFESIITKGSVFRFWLKIYGQQKAYRISSTLNRISQDLYQDKQLDSLLKTQTIMNDFNSNSYKSSNLRFIPQIIKQGEDNCSLNFSEDNLRLVNIPPQLQTNFKHQQYSSNQSTYKYQNNSCCAKILIVDDEFFNIFALQTFMKQYKNKTEYAFDGQEALNKINFKLDNPCLQCKQNSYKLIFLDINMPIKDGIQTVKEIKQMVNSGDLPNVCCAANSAFSDIQTKQRAYDAGVDFYLTKPLSLSILKALMIQVFQ